MMGTHTNWANFDVKLLQTALPADHKNTRSPSYFFSQRASFLEGCSIHGQSLRHILDITQANVVCEFSSRASSKQSSNLLCVLFLGFLNIFQPLPAYAVNSFTVFEKTVKQTHLSVTTLSLNNNSNNNSNGREIIHHHTKSIVVIAISCPCHLTQKKNLCTTGFLMIPAARNSNLSLQAKSTKNKEIPVFIQWLWQQNFGHQANEFLMKLLRETETGFLEIGLFWDFRIQF